MIVQWKRDQYSVPSITMDGRYVAMHRFGTLVIAEIPPIGPGVTADCATFDNAVPVLAVKFVDVASVHVIRQWLDAVERSIGPKWRYRNGD